MKLATIMFLTLIALLAPAQENKNTLFKRILIPEKLPLDFNLSYFSEESFDLKKLKERADLPEDIKKREIEYTFNWIPIRSDYRPLEKNISAEFFSNINGIDDGILISYSVHFGKNKVEDLEENGITIPSFKDNEYKIDILDSRMILVKIENERINKIKTDDLIKRFITTISGDGVRYNTLSEEKLSENSFCGKVDYHNRSQIFERTDKIEWYRNRSTFIFLVNKINSPPVTKGGITEDSRQKYVGGISYEDKRPFLRFEKSNREELAKEYYEKYFPPRAVKDEDESTGTLSGKKIISCPSSEVNDRK